MGVPISFLKKKIKNDQHDERNFFASSVFDLNLKNIRLLNNNGNLLIEPLDRYKSLLEVIALELVNKLIGHF